MVDYSIKINNEKLEQAFKLLAEAVERGNYTSYEKIEFRCEERALRIVGIGNRWIEISIQHAPLLALELLSAYFTVRNLHKEVLRQYETGVWD